MKSTEMKEIPAEKDEEKKFSDSSENKNSLYLCEIEEDLTQNNRVSFELHEITTDDGRQSEFTENDDDDVYVAVGKDDSSMDALIWALKNTVKISSTLYLIHVFPEVRYIPTLRKIPRSQVNKEQVEVYLNQERLNRREMMLKFLHLCAANNVKADAHLIESDSITKAILDLIPVLRIRTLVLGSSKSNLRKLKRGTGRGQHIQENASSFCKVVVVCEGRVVVDEKLMESCSPLEGETATSGSIRQFDQSDNYKSCSCFPRRSS